MRKERVLLIMKKIICGAISALTALSLISCAAVTDIEDRLDALAEGSAAVTAAPETPPPVTEAETTAALQETEPETTEAAPAVVETAAPAPADNGLPKISEFTPPYIFAVTFTYLDKDVMPAITDPDILWEALAWYGAYMSYYNGIDNITDEQLAAAMKTMTGSDAFIEMTPEFDADQEIIHEDGKYSFPEFNEVMPYYFGDDGMMDFFYVATDDSTECTGIIRENDGGDIYDFTVAYTFVQSGDGYVIDSFVFSDDNSSPRPQGDPVSYDFLREIGEASRYENILGEGEAMKKLQSYPGDVTDLEYDIVKNGHVAVLKKYQSNEGSSEYNCIYNGLEFSQDEKGNISCFPAGVDNEFWDMNFNDFFMINLESWMEQQLDAYVCYEDSQLQGIMAESAAEDGSIVTTQTVIFDKETHIAQSWATYTTYHYDSGDEIYGSTTTFEKVKISDIDHPLMSALSAFDGDLKTVRLVVLGDYGYTREYTMPADWELTIYEDEENMYADENCSKPFAYPGDGVDYTIYVSYAKG